MRTQERKEINEERRMTGDNNQNLVFIVKIKCLLLAIVSTTAWENLFIVFNFSKK